MTRGISEALNFGCLSSHRKRTAKSALVELPVTTQLNGPFEIHVELWLESFAKRLIADSGIRVIIKLKGLITASVSYETVADEVNPIVFSSL